MRNYILHFFISILPAISFGQDILVKRDSSKIEAKVLEISPTEIQYKYFNYQDGPTLIITKNEVAYVIYQNERREFFPVTDPGHNSDQTIRDQISKNDSSLKRVIQVRDYIKFNIQVAAVVYNSFSNVPRKNSVGRTYSDEYSRVSTKQNTTFNLGVNFVLGKSPYIKHTIGVNYLRTKGEFSYDQSGIGYSSYSRYTSYVSFINFVTGLRFTLFKKLHLEPAVTLNVINNSKTTHSGTNSSTNMQTYLSSSSSYENETTHTLVETTVSLSPKISYEIISRKIKMEAYASYNFAIGYRLPWYQVGLHIYPFKKLR